MKTNSSIMTYFTVAVFLVLFIVNNGCNSDDSLKIDEKSIGFDVVESNVVFNSKAGTGLIEFSEEKFTYEVNKEASTWMTITTIGTKALQVEVNKNETSDTRSAIIIAQKNNKKVYIPVTQRGAVNYADINNIAFGYEGGEQEFSFKFENKLSITSEGSDSWLKWDIVEDRIYFIAQPNIGIQSRQASVTLKAGLFEKNILVTQEAKLMFEKGQLVYENLLGSYIFKATVGDNITEIPVTIEANIPNKSVVLKGLAIDFLLETDMVNNILRLTTAQKTPSGVYIAYGSGLGSQDCFSFDILGAGKVKFEAKAEEAIGMPGMYRFIFSSNDKTECEVKDEQNNPTGIYKNPTGIVLLDTNSEGFYWGEDGNSLGVFFNFSMMKSM